MALEADRLCECLDNGIQIWDHEVNNKAAINYSRPSASEVWVWGNKRPVTVLWLSLKCLHLVNHVEDNIHPLMKPNLARQNLQTWNKRLSRSTWSATSSHPWPAEIVAGQRRFFCLCTPYPHYTHIVLIQYSYHHIHYTHTILILYSYHA